MKIIVEFNFDDFYIVKGEQVPWTEAERIEVFTNVMHETFHDDQWRILPPPIEHEGEVGNSYEQRFNLVMALLDDSMGKEHGLCKPRGRRACTVCNAVDDLKALSANWNGPTIYAQTAAPEVETSEAVREGYEITPTKCWGCGAPSTENCRRHADKACAREHDGKSRIAYASRSQRSEQD